MMNNPLLYSFKLLVAVILLFLIQQPLFSQSFNPCIQFPDAGGFDEAQSVGAIHLRLDAFAGLEDVIYVSGPTTIQRGPAMGDPISGRTIQTEIVQMELTGSGYIVPFVQVMINPGIPSQGLIQDINPDPGMEFPAQSD